VMYTAGVSGGALVLVLLAFAWLEFQTRKVRTPEEVVQGLGMRMVGTVPPLLQRTRLGWRRPESGDSTFAQSLLAESVDSAQTFMLHAARTEKLQIVMITSALPGEGKTSLAGHLAASLARAGRRTLLLDSDLHNPSLHRLFEMIRGPGLSEILRGELDLPNAIRQTPIPNLWLISAGQKELVALETLDNIRQVFDQLRPQYEFILVDSCPVLPVADSLLVGQHVDAVIFSLLREISRLPRVHAAYQRLAMLNVRILGAVVNGVQQEKYGADYGYGPR
jgi:polysaccharide biosynthesis transport protein